MLAGLLPQGEVVALASSVGIDFAIVYPTIGLGAFLGANRVTGAGYADDLRRCCVRAGIRLKTLFSSDISHFDVRDMTATAARNRTSGKVWT